MQSSSQTMQWQIVFVLLIFPAGGMHGYSYPEKSMTLNILLYLS